MMRNWLVRCGTMPWLSALANSDYRTPAALTSLCTPSAINTAACFDSFAKPPTNSSMATAVSALFNPETGRPTSHSVNADPHAIEAVHPLT